MSLLVTPILQGRKLRPVEANGRWGMPNQPSPLTPQFLPEAGQGFPKEICWEETGLWEESPQGKSRLTGPCTRALTPRPGLRPSARGPERAQEALKGPTRWAGRPAARSQEVIALPCPALRFSHQPRGRVKGLYGCGDLWQRQQFVL